MDLLGIWDPMVPVVHLVHPQPTARLLLLIIIGFRVPAELEEERLVLQADMEEGAAEVEAAVGRKAYWLMMALEAEGLVVVEVDAEAKVEREDTQEAVVMESSCTTHLVQK